MGVFRNPPWSCGPKVYLAKDIEDIVDWGLLAQGIPAVGVTGRGIRIGVCDTGRPQHSDLKDKIVQSKNFSNSFTDADAQGHGTHVAGIIGAAKNGKGIVGVAHECELVIAKVLGDDGSGDDVAVAKGVDFCAEQGCHIISMSVGGGFDETVAKAIEAVLKAGIFVICAAGNSGKVDGVNTVDFPAKLRTLYGKPLAVASYNRDGKISDFSSSGPEVDVAFPGEDILSCWLNDNYRRVSGTSMATPFASGVVAMLLAYQKEMEAAGTPVAEPLTNQTQLIARIQECCTDQGPAGQDDRWGWGIADIKKLIKVPVTPSAAAPAAPGVLLSGLMCREVVCDGKKGVFIAQP